MMDDEPMETSVPSKKTGKKISVHQPSAYIPGQGQMDEDEELVVDESAYVMLHEATTGDPCLSFEVLRDDLGASRERFPLTSYLLGGTQSEAGHFNYIMLLKMSNMHKTQKEQKKDEDDDESDSDDDNDEEEDEAQCQTAKTPRLHQTMIKHNGCVNRIKSTYVNDHLLSASWSEHGIVYIHDVTSQLRILDAPELIQEFDASNMNSSPLFSFDGHEIEGYALAWSKHNLDQS